jgi:hypothetical protein
MNRKISIALLFSCVVAACSGGNEALKYSWDTNVPFAPFQGDTATQGKLVDRVLHNMQSTDPITMFIAADTAYALSRLEDSGFLYNAASIRAHYDIDSFPPSAQGGDSPMTYLGFLRENAGQVINPALVDAPSTYIAVTRRLDAWDCRVESGYKPPWDFKKAAEEPPATCVKQQRPHVDAMKDIAALFQIPEYAAAVATNKRFNLSATAFQSADEQAKNQAALATMRRIESERHLKGFASYDD